MILSVQGHCLFPLLLWILKAGLRITPSSLPVNPSSIQFKPNASIHTSMPRLLSCPSRAQHLQVAGLPMGLDRTSARNLSAAWATQFDNFYCAEFLNTSLPVLNYLYPQTTRRSSEDPMHAMKAQIWCKALQQASQVVKAGRINCSANCRYKDTESPAQFPFYSLLIPSKVL